MAQKVDAIELAWRHNKTWAEDYAEGVPAGMELSQRL